MVLKGITCTFPGEKKIGVVGRTGNGKSTLMQALFRVVEPSGRRILIDGVEISKIGLQDLSFLPRNLRGYQQMSSTGRNNKVGSKEFMKIPR
ncbi:hypothetical protein LWI28_014843 [Acer negundo]|uniref:ABC transporter domain-containing protein n=1 Tax=Acer negundo TaxID=4023 RepID=A0AAD5IMH7_ACENE|nr:hypothetical protein LWI28_014843 [Acer negundo]